MSTATAPTTALAEPGTRSTALAITGFCVLSGIGPEALAAALAAPAAPVDVSEMFEEELPRDDAHALVDFKVRDHLGRKGTSFFDRSTSLGMVLQGGAGRQRPGDQRR